MQNGCQGWHIMEWFDHQSEMYRSSALPRPAKEVEPDEVSVVHALDELTVLKLN